MLDVGSVSRALKIASRFEKFIVQSPIFLYLYKSHFWRSGCWLIRNNAVAGRGIWARPYVGLSRAGLRRRGFGLEVRRQSAEMQPGPHGAVALGAAVLGLGAS